MCDIESDCIIGQDFLHEHVDSISYRRSCLIVGSKTIPLWMGGTALQICKVEVRNTTKIPAHSRAWIPVNIPFSEHLGPTGFIEPSFELIEKHGFCVVGGIVDVSNSDTLVSVVNLGSEPTTVYAKTTLGTCESYEECYDGPRIARVTEQELSQSLPEHLTELFERSAGHLNESEKADFSRLLCKYSSVFSSSSEDIGRTNLVQHTINTGHAAPIRQPPRRLPLGIRAI